MKVVKFLILPLFLILFSSTIIPFSFATESEEDIAAGCRDGNVLVLRYAYNDYICVIPSTAERWVELGMAEIISEYEQVEEVKPVESPSSTPQLYGAPPPPPEKIRVAVHDSECRAGYILVHQLRHDNTLCLEYPTALSWERLGLVTIIGTEIELEEQIKEQNVNDSEDPIDYSLKETEVIPNTNNEVEQDTNDKVEQDTTNELPESILLDRLNLLYPPKIHSLDYRIWVAVGYDVTNSIFIEGNNGIIVIDSLSSYESAKQALKEFRTITDKPIKTIIYTMIDPDLVNGSKAFLEEGDENVEIIVPEDLLLFYNNNYDLDVQATHTFISEFSLDISGVKMNLIHSAGEHSDQTYIILPNRGNVLIGDSVYGVFPFILEIESFQKLLD